MAKHPPVPGLDLEQLTDQQLRQLRADIDGERCRRYPPNEVMGVQVRIAIPADGVLLHIELPDDNLVTCDWFPDIRVAKLALSLFADELGLEVYNDGFSLDLTVPGGAPSKAWLEEREPIIPTTTGEER